MKAAISSALMNGSTAPWHTRILAWFFAAASAEAGTAAVLGQHQRRGAQPGQAAPHRLAVREALFEHLTRHLQRRLLDEELAHLVAQHVLLV